MTLPGEGWAGRCEIADLEMSQRSGKQVSLCSGVARQKIRTRSGQERKFQMAPRVKLRGLKGVYGVARLRSSDFIPTWADSGGFVSISRTDDELSIVCLQDYIPHDVRMDGGWSCFKFEGPFAFDETGIVLSVIEPLSTNGIGIFVVSTFDGDHLLVKLTDLEKAHDLLSNAGHALI